MITPLARKIIEKKLSLSIEEIKDKGSEQVDKIIEQKIINNKLQISQSSCGLVQKRGYVLGLVSIKDIDNEIDSFANDK